MIILFVLASLESLALGLFLISEGSQESNAALFNLSLSRLAISAAIFLAAIAFFILAVQAWRKNNKDRVLFSTILTSGRKLLLVFVVNVLLIISMFYLLTRPPSFGGDYRLVIYRLEPVFAWVILICTQAVFFTGIWFCAFFIVNRKKSIPETKKELLPVFIVFFIVLILKWVFVSSASYGPGVGDEMKYFDMAESLNRGFFSIAQTHVAPPLYSLTILPALVFAEYTFDLIKIINVIVSSVIIFPIYFICRGFLNKEKSLVVAIIACLNPFHLVFPRRILSENLYYLIFLWTMYFVHGKPFSKKAGLLLDVFTGIMLGLLYLTRYISLVVIPMFMLAWWVKPFDENDRLLKPSIKKITRFILIGAIAALVFCPWIIHAISEDVPAKLALGFVITAKTNPEQLTLSRFLIWLILYTAYIVIMISPLMPFILNSVASLKISNWREKYGRFIIQIALVLAGLLIAATRHSWRATYNAVIPTILMGRYVLFLAVPFLILFFITLDKYQNGKASQNTKKEIWLIIFSSVMVLLAYFIIIQPSIIQIEPYFARIETSADVFYIIILGAAFWIITMLLYYLYFNFYRNEQRRTLVFRAITAILMVFFLWGWPQYSQMLLAKQTNSWLSSQVANLARVSISDKSGNQEITLFIPDSFGNKEKIEIYNGLRVRAFDNTKFFTFNEENVATMPTSLGVVVIELTDLELSEASDPDYLEFNDRYFKLDVITK